MATESELRDRFRDDDGRPTGTSGGIDVDSVIRRSRARRAPRIALTGGIAALAVIGLAVPAIGASGILNSGGAAVDTAAGGTADGGAKESAAEAPQDDATMLAPLTKLNPCGGTLAEVAPAENGLVLSVVFPMVAPGATQVEGTATLTNTGPVAVTGTTAPNPLITVSQNTAVMWHSNGPTIMSIAVVDLAPGESMDFPASFTPVRCNAVDEEGEFRENLPPLPAGQYQVSAALEVLEPNDARALVTGPAAEIAIP